MNPVEQVIAVILYGGFMYLMPLIVGIQLIRYLRRRGHSVGCIVGTAILLPVIFSIFALPLYLLIWRANRSYLAADIEQRQCPNCGGYKCVSEMSKRLRKADPIVFKYHCELCGYNWSWQPDTPWPAVTVRPDVIANGQQLLDQKAAEKAAKEEERAAFYAQYDPNGD